MMRGFLEGLDEKKRKKIESMSDAGQTPSSVAVEAENPALAAAPAPAKSSASTAKRAVAPPVSAPAAKAEAEPATKKSLIKSASGGVAKSSSTNNKAGASGKSSAGQGKEDSEAEACAGVSVEELDVLVDEVVSGAIRAKISSANWKERLEGIEELDAEIKGKIDTLQHPLPEAVTRMLIKSFVDKKETNFQVVASGLYLC